MPAAVPAVSLVFRRYAHHSRWSGYYRYTEYLDGMVRARRIASTSPPRLLIDVAYKRLGWRDRSGWPIDPERLSLYLNAARALVLRRGELMHLLHGDFDYARHLRRMGHLRGNRLVATIHQPPEVEEKESPLSIYQYIDAAIALGSRSAAHISDMMGSRSVFRASHGVDIRAWHPHYSLQSATPVCVLVGSYLRDFAVFEDVVRLVVHEMPSVRFEVVTAPSHADALTALPNLRAWTGIPDTQLRALYQRAWIHVLPLVDAVANNALLDGMACGIPTITTAVGDVLDYTKDRGAICVAPHDAGAMADAVLGLIRDPPRRRKLGHAARDVAETFSFEISARQHAEIYAKLSPPSDLRIRRTRPNASSRSTSSP